VRIYHFDSRGSTLALTDPGGAVTDRYAYAPYGAIVGREGDTENPFTYNGRDGVIDDGNGLLYMRSRYYAPELMRYIQKDQVFAGALSDPQSVNRYAYVQGNPILRVDPNGEFWWTVIAVVVNVAMECLDGCTLEEGLQAGVSAAIPFGGTLWELGRVAFTDAEFDAGKFFEELAWDAVGGVGDVGKGAGKKVAKKAKKEAAKHAKGMFKGGGKESLQGFLKARKSAKSATKAASSFEAFSAAVDVTQSITEKLTGDDSGDRETRDGGTATDDWNPVAAPMGSGEPAEPFCGCTCEIWR
jgi:RHS repeat-associated protein